MRWPLRRVQVHGESMQPSLQPGDRLLVAGFLEARPGDVVAVVDPRDEGRTMVKRVATVDSAGVTVLGDNPDASTDSRTFGPVPSRLLLGRVVYRYWPEPRRGRVP
jgi:nickel-type superoxide dismutase maturation protease